jgi:hypothetical protein
MDFERLSSNLIAIVDEVLRNQDVVNYIGYDSNEPESQSINPVSIAPYGEDERIFVYPFDVNYKGDIRTQLHVYYPEFELVNNANVGRIHVLFDIVCHRNIWLVMDKDRKLIRPYQIVKCLTDSFRGRIVPNLGKIHFKDGSHVAVNSEFECIRLVATITEF